MKIKKIINTCLCLVITISMLSSYNVKASENQASYYKTFKFSLADEYVSNNIGEFLNAEAQKSLIDISSISVGSGIYVEDFIASDTLPMFYYPVFLNNTLKYVFRIYDDGNGSYTGAFSQNYAEELLKNSSTSQENAITWAITNGNEIALEDSSYKVIIYSHYGEKIDQETIDNFQNSNDNTLHSVNIAQEKLDFKKHPQIRAYYVTPISYLETQGNNNWCLGYVTTSAIRTISGNNSVRTSNMATAYGVPTSSAISWANVKNYSSRYGVSFAGPYNGTISASSIYLEISNRDLILGAYQSGSTYHALLIHGVNGNSIQVWNPWYSNSEWISSPLVYYGGGRSWSMYAYGMYR